MKGMILIPLFMAGIFASGCSAPSKSNSVAAASASSTPPRVHASALEGAWKGRVVTPGREGPASIIFSGQTLEFHGDGTNNWVKGTFTLRENTDPKQLVGIVTECAAPEYVGQKAYAIYKIENGTLTLTGNLPGVSNFPAAFDDPDAGQIVFQRVR